MTSISKAVVLGGTGFVGRAVRSRLGEAGLAVAAFGSKDLDLRRPESLEILEPHLGPATAVVFAAVTRARPDAPETYAVNRAMAENAARFLGARRLGVVVYFSTVAVYGRRSANLAITEETPIEPDTAYARAKREGEEILRSAGVPLLVLRPCKIYGPGDEDPYGPTRFVREILETGAVTLYGGGEELRDHVFSEDAGKIVAALVAGGARGVYNLATGRSRAYQEIVGLLRGIVGRPFEVRSKARTLPFIDQGFDVSRLLRAAPGFAFTPLEEGLRRTFEALA